MLRFVKTMKLTLCPQLGLGFQFQAAFLLALSTWTCSAALCLPNGIPEAQRLYVFNASNEESPIRFKAFSWRSALMTTYIAEILISEVIGYHATVDPEAAFYTENAIALLAGCLGADCEVKGTRPDILLDTWLTPAFQYWDDFQVAHPQVAEDLGSMGYVGGDGMYIKGSVLSTAADSGVALEYYKSYNLSFHEPNRYFDTLWDLPPADILNCNGTFFGSPLETQDSARMKNYLDWTGDTDGVFVQNGKYQATCQLAQFWISPACRQNYTACIPVVMFGVGMMHVYMQWSVAYGMPLALTHAFDMDSVTRLIRNQRILYYWWEPDDTLLDLNHARIIFPQHSPAAWSQGDVRTSSDEVYIAKLASSLLRISAPRVNMFLKKMKLESGQLLEMLKDSSFQANVDQRMSDLRDHACDWIKSNGQIWDDWMPVATDCAAGYGLTDAQGFPVPSVAEAVECKVCPAGHFSQMFASLDGGQNYRCVKCDPGQHQQQSGQSKCLACEEGSFAAEAGQATCSPCERGSYGNKSGAAHCYSCGPEEVWTTSKAVQVGAQERWIEIEGATSENSCHCMEGMHLSSGQCEVCVTGSICPGSGELMLLPGYYSTLSDAGAVLQCFGNSLRCPGGSPETCAAGRDPASPACSSCLPGLQPSAEKCVPCQGGDYVALAALALVVLLGTGILHLVLLLADRTSGLHRGALLGAALCMNQLITCAQLFVVMEQIQDITWSEPFLSFLQFFRVLSLETLLDSVKTIGCVARIPSELTFLIRTLMVPLFFAVGPTVAQLVLSQTNLSPKPTSLIKTFGFLFLLFYISLCSSFVEPFRCNVHPNGLLTMQTAHDVFCTFSGTHFNLCWMSCLICLLPISFLAVCTYVLLVLLPRRVHSGNAIFIRACSFLILRFKPGYEAFTVAFLVRNLLFVLMPTMHSSSSLFVMGNLLALTAVSVAYFKPWRSTLATQIDVLVSSVLVSVLLLGSLTVENSKQEPLMVLCTVCGSLIIITLIMGTLYSVIQHISSRFLKKFAFFLSHHRTAAAAYARLVRMELKERGFTAFIDSDNLTDLSRLFSYVSHDTQTFILFGTPQILRRKWCVGELVMARLAGVETVLLSFPNFNLPDDAFIRTYAKTVPEITELAVYGLGLSEVQDTLHWLSTVTSRVIAPKFSRTNVTDVLNHLTGTTGRDKGDNTSVSVSEYLILADPDNMEAQATAEVMGISLTGIIPERGLTVRVLTPEDAVSRTTDNHIILLCTQGCFQSQHLARWLLQVRVVPACKLLPVVADEFFQVPRRHGGSLDGFAAVGGVDDFAYSQVIRAVFLEVALPFIPSQSSEVDLSIRSRQIAERLYGDLKPLSTKLLIVAGAIEPEKAPSGTESSNASLHLLNRHSKNESNEIEAALQSETVTQAF